MSEQEKLNLLQKKLNVRLNELALVDEKKYIGENINETVYKRIASNINKLTRDTLQSKPEGSGELLKKINTQRSSIETLKNEGKISSTDYMELINSLNMSSSILETEFSKIGGKVTSGGKIISPEQTVKGKIKSQLKKNIYAGIGTAVGSLFDSPLPMMLGSMIDQSRERKQIEKEQEESEYEDLIREFADMELSEKKVKERKKERKKEEKKLKKETKQKKQEIDIVEDVDDGFEKIKHELDFSGVAKDIGIEEDVFDELKDELSSLQDSIDYNSEATDDSGVVEELEMVEGNLGDIYDLLGDVKDIFKSYFKEWKNVSSEQQVKDRDRWLQGLYNYFVVERGDNIKGGIDKTDAGLIKDSENFFKKGGKFLPAITAFFKKHGLKLGAGAVLVKGIHDFAKGMGKEEEFLGPGTFGGVSESMASGGAGLIHKGTFGLVSKEKASKIADVIEYGADASYVKKARRFNAINFSRDIYDLAIANDEDAVFHRNFLKEHFPDHYKNVEKIKKWVGTEVGKKWLKRREKRFSDIRKTGNEPKTGSQQKMQTPMGAQKSTISKSISSPSSYVFKESEGIKTDDLSGALELRRNVELDGLDSGFLNNLKMMAKEYQMLTGERLPINSAYRSYADQKRLSDTIPGAAKPGTSMHEYGYAIDTDTMVAEKLKTFGLLSKYGITQPYPKKIKGISERHHLEKSGIDKSQVRTKSPSTLGEPDDRNMDMFQDNRRRNLNQNTNFASLVQQNNMIIGPKDYRFFVDDLELRMMVNNGLT